MPVPIPYAMAYTAKAGGMVWKLVGCEHCNTLFAYQMQRWAKGGAVSVFFLNNQGAQERASDLAQQKLLKMLETDFNVLPCPTCGKYQRYMYWRIQGKQWGGLQGWGALCFILALPIAIVGYLFSISSSYNANRDIPWMMRNCYITAGTLCGLGFALMVLSGILGARHDPNNAAEHGNRMGEAKARTISGAELEKMLAEAVAKIPSRPAPAKSQP